MGLKALTSVLLAAACGSTQVADLPVRVQAGGPATLTPPQPPPTSDDDTRVVRVAARDFAIYMRVPADSEVTTKGDTAYVRSGGHFLLTLQRGGNVDVETRRRDVLNTVGLRLQGFLIDAPDALLYETLATRDGQGGGYHVYAQIPTGVGVITCRTSDDLPFTRDEAEAMLTTCRSIAVEGAAPRIAR